MDRTSVRRNTASIYSCMAAALVSKWCRRAALINERIAEHISWPFAAHLWVAPSRDASADDLTPSTLHHLQLGDPDGTTIRVEVSAAPAAREMARSAADLRRFGRDRFVIQVHPDSISRLARKHRNGTRDRVLCHRPAVMKAAPPSDGTLGKVRMPAIEACLVTPHVSFMFAFASCCKGVGLPVSFHQTLTAGPCRAANCCDPAPAVAHRH